MTYDNGGWTDTEADRLKTELRREITRAYKIKPWLVGLAPKPMRRFYWWDRSLWWRTYTPGGFDGYRTLTGRRLPCAAMADALRFTSLEPETQAQLMRIAARRR